MKEPEIVVSLDIGTTKIAAMIGKKDKHDKVEILGMGKTESLGVKRGIVVNISQTADSIRTAIDEAVKQAGVHDVKFVNVGIAGQHIKSVQQPGYRTRDSVDEEITQKDIDELVNDMYKLVMQPGEEIIHVLPQEFRVDGEEGNPIGMYGSRLEANFHIIIGKVAAARNIIKCVQKAGLEVVEVILEPLASSEAVLSEEEKEAGVLLVDIGGGTTDVAIFQDGIIRHTAVIPFGGSVITNDIKEGCSIIRKQAELLKIKFGSALASETQENEIVSIPGLRGREPKEISVMNLAHIIQARMEEIIEHVYYELRNSGYEDKLIGGIVVTGGGAQLKHISQLFEFVTGKGTRVGYPNEHLAPIGSGLEEVTSPIFSTGIGLVIKGFESLEKQEEGKRIVIHSKKKKSSFFDQFFNKSREFFEEKDIDEEQAN
ncbi:MAG: cell division protein FtsA [Bacteroidota bacterium]